MHDNCNFFQKKKKKNDIQYWTDFEQTAVFDFDPCFTIRGTKQVPISSQRIFH